MRCLRVAACVLLVGAISWIGEGTASAEVDAAHPGLTLVRNSGRATLVVNLCAPGVSLRATRYDERAQTAATWGPSLGLQAAINADFFDFPAATLVMARARGDGEDWPSDKQNREPDRPYWQFGPQLVQGVSPGLAEPSVLATEIVGGHNVLIQNGKSTGPWSTANDGALLNSTHRRTAVGVSADRRWLYLTTIDSAVTANGIIAAMTSDVAEAGAPPIDYATNMDGGGSTQMWVSGWGSVIPSSRVVANHLGVWATGTGEPTHCISQYHAEPVSQTFPSATEEPVVLAGGEEIRGTIEFTNLGTKAWTPGTTKLAPMPRDVPSPLVASDWLDDNRAATVEAVTPPGSVGRFTFSLRGNEGGDHVQYFGLVEEGVTWFDDPPLGGGPSGYAVGVHVVVESDGEDGNIPGGFPTTGGGADGGDDGGDGGGSDDTSSTFDVSGGRADGEQAGCGCTSTPGAAGFPALLVLLGLRRRSVSRQNHRRA